MCGSGLKRTFEEMGGAEHPTHCRQRLSDELSCCNHIEDSLAHCNMDEIDHLLYALDVKTEDIYADDFLPRNYGSFSPAFGLSPALFDDDFNLSEAAGTDAERLTAEICTKFSDKIDDCVENKAQVLDVRPVRPVVADPSPPKGYVSAFNFFVVHQRPRVLAENPALKCSNNTLNKILGEQWKALPQSGREHYVEQANEDKQRYLREVAVYNTTADAKIIPRINPPPGFDMNGDSISASKLKGRVESVLVPAVKRPLTAYSIFAQQEKQFILGLECSELQRRMGRYFGIRWKQMDSEEKDLYIALEEANRQSCTTNASMLK